MYLLLHSHSHRLLQSGLGWICLYYNYRCVHSKESLFIFTLTLCLLAYRQYIFSISGGVENKALVLQHLFSKGKQIDWQLQNNAEGVYTDCKKNID